MANDGDDKDNVVDLSKWRNKKTNFKSRNVSKSIWVSDSDPKLIVKINDLDLTIDLIGYDKNNKKHYFKRLTLFEIAKMLKAIQDEYSKF